MWGCVGRGSISELFVQCSDQHVDSRMRCGFVARSCGVGTEPVVIAHMTKSNQNVVGGGGAVRVSSRSCLGRPLRVRGSVYEVIVSYPAGRRMLHVCVDMILSPDRASSFKLLFLHRQVPSLFWAFLRAMPKYLWYWASVCPLEEVGQPMCAQTVSSSQTLEAQCSYRFKTQRSQNSPADRHIDSCLSTCRSVGTF